MFTFIVLISHINIFKDCFKVDANMVGNSLTKTIVLSLSPYEYFDKITQTNLCETGLNGKLFNITMKLSSYEFTAID